MSSSADLFCSRCGNILELPRFTGDVTCGQCGFTRSDGFLSERVVVSRSRVLKGEVTEDIGEEDHLRSQATISGETCPKCSCSTLSYQTVQTRSADEGQTIFYTCTKCHHRFTVNA